MSTEEPEVDAFAFAASVLAGTALGAATAVIPPVWLSVPALAVGGVCGLVAALALVWLSDWVSDPLPAPHLASFAVSFAAAAGGSRWFLLRPLEFLAVAGLVAVVLVVRWIPARTAERRAAAEQATRATPMSWTRGHASVRVGTSLINLPDLSEDSGWTPGVGAHASWRRKDGWTLTVHGFTSRWSDGQATAPGTRSVVIRDPEGRVLADERGRCRIVASEIAGIGFSGRGECADLAWDPKGPHDLPLQVAFEFTAEN